ncbi:MAG: riboflavin biosynthesis protein RibD [Thermoleophilia bacterium]|nr:riboflavin biosynthesis protein RibD [Thermoleophilia bacterium]
MKIRTRICVSLDGYVTTPDGLPAQLGDPAWSPEAFGFREFQASCDAVLMGRTTFEPALAAEAWPWDDLDVFVLGSRRPANTPDHVVVESDPARLLEKMRGANRGGDVHLVGGPRTIETFRQLRALDLLGVIVLPVLIGDGMQLTPSLGLDTRLTLESERSLPTGAVEIIYACA